MDNKFMSQAQPAPPPPPDVVGQSAPASNANVTKFLALVNEVEMQITELDRKLTLAVSNIESLRSINDQKTVEKATLDKKLKDVQARYDALRLTLVQEQQTRDVFASKAPELGAQRRKLEVLHQRVNDTFESVEADARQ
jgi:septal ring factor EnvC (AmiA/AmiB activator)